MKRIVTTALLLALVAGTALAQVPRGTAEMNLGGESIEIEYGRPSLRGRDMLGQAGTGTVWRMGADGATTLKTGTGLTFGSSSLPAGSYTLRARKEDSGWTLLIGGGGQSLEVPLETSSPAESVETFTIELKADGTSGGTFSMAWGTMKASAGFTAN